MTTTIDDANDFIIYQCPSNTPLNDRWGRYGDSRGYNGSYHYAYGALCYTEFTFTGQAVRIVGGSWFQNGVFSCSVDNETTYWFNSWRENETLYNQTVCLYDGLTSGSHTIRITSAPLAGRQLIIDAIEVTPAGFGAMSLAVSSDSPTFTLPSLIATQIVTATQTVTATPESRLGNGAVAIGLACGLGVASVIAVILSMILCCQRRKKIEREASQPPVTKE